MPGSIISCPSCNAMLLKDTVQCPSCHHVLDPAQPSELVREPKQHIEAEQQDQDACPGCGEMVRRGLVRCWNCGTFMREDIAETYQQMKQSPAPIIYSPLPDEEVDDNSPVYTYDGFDEEDDAEQDFELAPEIESAESDDNTFQIAGDSSPISSDESSPAIAPPVEPQMADESTQVVNEGQQPSEDGLPPEQGEQLDENSVAATDSSRDDDREEHHSVATGGDVLLQVALEQEAERGRQRADSERRRNEGAGTISGIVVYCPNGHRIEVQERHRGKTGRCPRCREPFIVPSGAWHEAAAEPDQAKDKQETKIDDDAEGTGQFHAGEYVGWMNDVHHHRVDPAKLKLKAGSLQNAFETVDFGFAPSGLLLVNFSKKGGLFGSSKQHPGEIRAEIHEHLSDEKPLGELPCASHELFDPEAVQAIRIVQPAASEYESIFAGVPVFGEGRIAVRFPKIADEVEQRYASFGLSQFRSFSLGLAAAFGIKDFGEDCGIPLAETYSDLTCHYSESPIKALDDVNYYQADPTFELKVIGRRCAECGLALSEDSRKKEKLGGVTGRGITKATCPKCKKKFGNISLYGFADESKSDISGI